MNEFRVEGLILKTVPYGEGHHILNVFSKENGLIALFAKKRKKVSPSLLSPLVQAEFVIRQGKGELYPCEEISPLASFLKIRERIETLEAAFQILNALLASQYPHKPAPHLYLLLIRYLHALPHSLNANSLATSFLLKTLRHEGVFGLSNSCATCQLPLESESYIFEGETFCFEHSPSHALSLNKEELNSLLFLASCRILPEISVYAPPASLYQKTLDLFYQTFRA
ncbi:DNA repair protein RecO [Parachlamydia sp. AcF125]|uniref:DNA repair protein RecO n=1 Tax=Parachlamydia sp. AcF125 TaxID=2795736 RepID=UPI001BC9AA2B|nr:DNA repair protein RecO [Parachlamydia sp. AcF125]MBS4169132.1 DNA repair protein RecO [Parachlamydia sp. AcF125]